MLMGGGPLCSWKWQSFLPRRAGDWQGSPLIFRCSQSLTEGWSEEDDIRLLLGNGWANDCFRIEFGSVRAPPGGGFSRQNIAIKGLTSKILRERELADGFSVQFAFGTRVLLRLFVDAGICQRAIRGPSLKTDTVLKVRCRESSRRLRCASVMAVRKRCDENGERVDAAISSARSHEFVIVFNSPANQPAIVK